MKRNEKKWKWNENEMRSNEKKWKEMKGNEMVYYIISLN